MALPGRIARVLRALRGRGRVRHQLARIERALESETRLAAMFATFNALCRGERPSGAEQFPRRFGWLRPRAWLTPTIALVAMTVVVVGGLLLTLSLRPPSRPCMMLTAAGTPVAAPVAVPIATPAASSSSRPAGGVARTTDSSHEALCSAYPADK
jgi:hypothetical protein